MARRQHKYDAEEFQQRPTDEFPTPFHEYVYSMEQPTIEQVGTRWAKNQLPGWSYGTIVTKARKEKWAKQRENFHNDIRYKTEEAVASKLAEGQADMIIDANKRHIMLGKMLQQLGGQCLKKKKIMVDNTPTEKMVFIKATDGSEYDFKGANEVVRSIQMGVGIERQALGLADQIVRVQFIRDVAKTVMKSIEKYVSDPVVLQNIALDLENVLRLAEEELEETAGTQLPKTSLIRNGELI